MATIVRAALTLSILVGTSAVSSAATIGYAEAIDRLAASCGKDIQKHCSTVNLGGGRVMQCLSRNEAKISADCKSARRDVTVLMSIRATARANVPKLCDADIRRLCAGVQQGDGNLLECFMKTESRASAKCRQAVGDAGYR